jgi:hypothetical protein
MIQLNLLPDIKQDYIKAERQKRIVLSVTVLVSILAVIVLVALMFLDVFYKHQLTGLNKNIASESQTLKQEPHINTILTVQNQLESLTALHSSKPAVSRLFVTYLNEITPATVSISTLHADFTQYTLTLTGSANALSSINQYVDTFKKTTYTTNNDNSPKPAFNDVVLSSFGLNSASDDPSQAASYSIDLNFDKTLFDNTQNVTLSIPDITTRADVNQPASLFSATPVKPAGSNQ